jgi:hypothetical protein
MISSTVFLATTKRATTKTERLKAKHWRADPWPASNERTSAPQLHKWIPREDRIAVEAWSDCLSKTAIRRQRKRRQENNGKRKLLKRKT